MVASFGRVAFREDMHVCHGTEGTFKIFWLFWSLPNVDQEPTALAIAIILKLNQGDLRQINSFDSIQF